MFCRKCGNQIPEGVSFCAKCGTPVRSAAPQSNAQPKPQNVNVNSYSNPVAQNTVSNDIYQPAPAAFYDNQQINGTNTNLYSDIAFNDIPVPGENKKKKTSKIIASLISILVAVAIVFSGIFTFVVKADDWYYNSKTITYSVSSGEAEENVTYEYHENGQMLSVFSETEGISIECEYDTRGRFKSISAKSDEDGYTLDFDYSKDGKNYVASANAEKNGKKIEMELTYDSGNRIVNQATVETDEDGIETLSETEYTYKNGKLLSTVTKENGEQKSEKNIEYYFNGKVKSITSEGKTYKYVTEYDKDGNKTSYTSYDDDGEIQFKTEYTYEKGRLVGQVEKKDGEKTSELKLDEQNKDKIEFEVYDNDELSGYKYVYYEGKNIITEESYDKDKNLTSVYEYEYDKHSNKISTKRYSVDGNGDKVLASQSENEYSRKSIKQFFREIFTDNSSRINLIYKT